MVMIDEKIEDDLLSIRTCVEKKNNINPPEPVKKQPKGSSPEMIKDSRE